MVILGTGKAKFEKQVQELDRQFKGRYKGVVKFSAPLAHLITAGADFILVPSRFEPCGLIQLHAMQYGTVPVVSSTGGLVDTVKEGVTGFHMGALNTVRRAPSVFLLPPGREARRVAFERVGRAWRGWAQHGALGGRALRGVASGPRGRTAAHRVPAAAGSCGAAPGRFAAQVAGGVACFGAPAGPPGPGRRRGAGQHGGARRPGLQHAAVQGDGVQRHQPGPQLGQARQEGERGAQAASKPASAVMAEGAIQRSSSPESLRSLTSGESAGLQLQRCLAACDLRPIPQWEGVLEQLYLGLSSGKEKAASVNVPVRERIPSLVAATDKPLTRAPSNVGGASSFTAPSTPFTPPGASPPPPTAAPASPAGAPLGTTYTPRSIPTPTLTPTPAFSKPASPGPAARPLVRTSTTGGGAASSSSSSE